jgi:hypothetical protein
MKLVHLRFNLAAPWDYFKSLGRLSGRLTRYKAWELEHTYYAGSFVDCEFAISAGEDHAGFELAVGLLGYGVSFRVYDTRHWNYQLEKWMETHYG